MAKIIIVVGYASSVESVPGVHTEEITEHTFAADLIQDSRRWQVGQKINDDLTVSNRVSIIADSFATVNVPAMRYVKWMGVSWKINSFEVQRPRLILSLGGVYNGQVTS